MMNQLRKSWTKLAAGCLLLGALGAGGKAAYDRYAADDCCYPGSPCCTGGACCMRDRRPSQ